MSLGATAAINPPRLASTSRNLLVALKKPKDGLFRQRQAVRLATVIVTLCVVLERRVLAPTLDRRCFPPRALKFPVLGYRARISLRVLSQPAAAAPALAGRSPASQAFRPPASASQLRANVSVPAGVPSPGQVRALQLAHLPSVSVGTALSGH